MLDRRSPVPARLTIAAVLLLAVGACGGKGGSTPTDGGTDVLADTGTDTPAETGGAGCDPAAQNCAAGSKCDLTCQGMTAAIACIPGTDGSPPGTPCASSTPCTPGTGCLTAPDAGAVCRTYCAGDPDCATGQRCHNVTVAVGCGGTSPPLSLHYCY